MRNTIKAIAWLKSLPEVLNNKVALTGFSRGAEQAVLLATIQDASKLVDAVAVHTPSDTIVNGFSWAPSDKRCWICSTPDTACFNNSDDLNKWNWQNMRWNPSCGAQPGFPTSIVAWILDGTPLKVGDVIEIEKFKKPVFITVGDKDELWDYNKSIRIADRLKQYGQSAELHVFPGEHHVFSLENENKRHELLLKFLANALQ